MLFKTVRNVRSLSRLLIELPAALAALSALLMSLNGCATGLRYGRVFLDSSVRKDEPPTWVRNPQVAWEEDGKIYFRSTHTIRGDERVNGCFDLARMDVREELLTEIANDIRGRVDNAQQSLSENAEVILGKLRSGDFEGKVSGLRIAEQYFERYQILTPNSESERVECHVLSEIKERDYADTKRLILYKLVAVDPRLKEAILRKRIDFFERSPAAVSVEAEPKTEAQSKHSEAESE